MSKRYWLIHPNGARQLIDPEQFDLDHLAEQAQRIGGRLVVENRELATQAAAAAASAAPALAPMAFEPPVSALGPLFLTRLERIYVCQHDFTVDVNQRPTVRVLGGYYRNERLVRVYSHDRLLGRRPLEELFDTFLHEVAHHIEYTEPRSFRAQACGRVHGRMHSQLFWRILGELKGRWVDLQNNPWESA
jgi:hypothetical protein